MPTRNEEHSGIQAAALVTVAAVTVAAVCDRRERRREFEAIAYLLQKTASAE